MSMSAPPDKIRHPKKAAMLAAIAKTGNISASARAAEIDRSTHYEWLHADPDYAAAVDQALEDAIDVLEAVARKRAIVGSDVLLIFLLKGARPERYRERYQVEHAGKVAVEKRGDALEILRDPAVRDALSNYHARRAYERQGDKLPFWCDPDDPRQLPAPAG